MSKKPKPLSEQLRAAILTAGKTRYEIAQDTGLTESALSRFVNGGAGMGLKSIDILGVYLGLQLAPRRRINKSQPKGK